MLREFYRPFASHFAAVLVAVVEMWCAECAKNAPFAPIISFQCQVKFAKMKFIKSSMRDTAWLAAVRQNLMLLARFSVWLNDSLEIWNASQGKRKRASARCALVSSRRKDWTNDKMAHKWNEWTNSNNSNKNSFCFARECAAIWLPSRIKCKNVHLLFENVTINCTLSLDTL